MGVMQNAQKKYNFLTSKLKYQTVLLVNKKRLKIEKNFFFNFYFFLDLKKKLKKNFVRIKN